MVILPNELSSGGECCATGHHRLKIFTSGLKTIRKKKRKKSLLGVIEHKGITFRLVNLGHYREVILLGSCHTN